MLWLPDGRLLVAGGHIPGSPVLGTKATYLFNPQAGTHGAWEKADDPQLQDPRWYAGAGLLFNGKALVGGGTEDERQSVNLNGPANTYQIFDWRLGRYRKGSYEQRNGVYVWDGPRRGVSTIVEIVSPLFRYPFLVQLSERCYAGQGPVRFRDGRMFMNGRYRQSASVDHEAQPGKWDDAPQPMRLSPADGYVEHAVSALAPWEVDVVMQFGGLRFQGQQRTVLSTIQFIDNKAQNPAWEYGPALVHPRYSCAGAVILCDGSVLLVRGEDASGPRYDSELYKNGRMYLIQDTSGTPNPVQPSPRTHHSTALLLEDGRVLVTGGKTRTWDYQIYKPHYLDGSPQPQIVNAPGTMQYGSVYTVTFEFDPPPGVQVERAVLIAPGAVTHHVDASQRFVPLESVLLDEQTLQVQAPPNATYAPRGWYMLFLLTNTEIPCVRAAWVKLQ